MDSHDELAPGRAAPQPGDLAGLARYTPIVRELRAEVRALLNEERSGKSVVLAAKAALRLTSRLAESSPLRARWMCGRGCAWCCSSPVSVSSVEALRIADRIRAGRTPEQVCAVIDALRDRVGRYVGKPWGAQGDEGVFCVFLGAEKDCTIYADRPIACRQLTSIDVAACERTYRAADDDEGGAPADPMPMAAAGLARVGLQLGLRDVGIDLGGPLELQAAVLAALSTADAADCWLAGQDPFAQCTAAGGNEAGDMFDHFGSLFDEATR